MTTFGTLWYSVADNLNLHQTDIENVAAIHRDRARKAVMDAVEHYRGTRLAEFETAFGILPNDVSVAFVDFEDASPKYQEYNYDANTGVVTSAAGVERKIDRILSVDWQDLSTGKLNPVKYLPFEEFVQLTKTTESGVGDRYDYYSWYANKLWVFPYPDGATPLYINALLQPNEYRRERSAGAWLYYVNGTLETDIDAVTDATFNRLGNLFILKATTDLLTGPYADERGSRMMLWRSLVQDEETRLKHERAAIGGPMRVRACFDG